MEGLEFLRLDRDMLLLAKRGVDALLEHAEREIAEKERYQTDNIGERP